jgi:hypothetical protein
MMEVVRTSETPVYFNEITWSYIQKNLSSLYAACLKSFPHIRTYPFVYTIILLSILAFYGIKRVI